MESKILKLKRWERECYQDGGHEIGMEMKRLRFDEANRLMVANMEAFAALQTDAPTNTADRIVSQAEQMEALAKQAQAARRFYAAIPGDLVDWIFKDCIRNVTGLEDEDGPVTTGEGLKQFVDQKMVLWILTTLQSHASLTSAEGKGSSSPSTSGSEGPTLTEESGACPVPSTGSASEAGSTATQTPN